MTLQLLLQYGTLWSLIVAAFGVIFAMVTHRRQVNASIFLDLSGRLHKLYQSIPPEMRTPDFTGTEAGVHSMPAALVIRDFLNLMNAAYTLRKSGYFTGPLWKALEAEAKHGLQLPIFRAQWPFLRQYFTSNPAFIKYVERVQST